MRWHLSREEQATPARNAIHRQFNIKQQFFLDFVLLQYIIVDAEELDQAKLAPLLRLKYHTSITDAIAELRAAEDIATFHQFP